MYQKYYGLHESPFQLTTDTKFVYWSQTHQNAYRHLLYSVESHKSLIVLAGAVGTGKTTLLHVLMEWIKTTMPTARVAYVVHSTLTVAELFRYIFHELGLDFTAPSKVDYVLALQRFSQQCAGKGERLLLILDEAQNYSHDVLEEIRLLSNIETPQDKLLQIILAGQPQLLTNINRPEIYQLKQRVNVTYNLQPLNHGETQAYIQKRLDVAGAQGRSLFQDDAIEAIYLYSQGIPRVINVVCDHALLYSFAANKKRVSEKIVQEVAVDMGLRQEQRLPRLRTSRPASDEEAAPEADHQADRIVISHTKTSTEQDVAGAAPFYGTFARYADWGDDGVDNKKRTRRKSLFQLAGIVVFIILILVGMSFVWTPSSQKEASTMNPSIISRNNDNLEKSQEYSQKLPEKEIQSLKEQPPPYDNNKTSSTVSKYPETNASEKKGRDTPGTDRYIRVKQGDTFMKILLEAYGQYDEPLVAFVLGANPEISNINTIFVGQLIRLPEH
jgi:general secretion pathway protein A